MATICSNFISQRAAEAWIIANCIYFVLLLIELMVSDHVDGFQMENALTRTETLRGMTIWGAYFNFEENEKGSLEVGKSADFIILDQNIMEINADKIQLSK